MPELNFTSGTVYRGGVSLGQVQRIIRAGVDIWTLPATSATRTASTATTRTCFNGHSLMDAAIYGGGWPGYMMLLRNALMNPDDNPDAPVYVVKDTIPGSPLSWRWNVEGAVAARDRPEDFDSLVITHGNRPQSETDPGFEVDFLDYLCRFTANQIENGAGNDVVLWTIWQDYDEVNPPPSGWEGFDTFPSALAELGRRYEEAADYTTWKMKQQYPALPVEWRVGVFPGHEWWRQVIAAIALDEVPGIASLDDLFLEDHVHANNVSGWGLTLFMFTCVYQMDLRGNAIASAMAPAELPAGLHDYFCDLAWTLANSYPRAGLVGPVTDERWNPATDVDPMPLWTFAAPTTDDPVAVSVSTPPSITPAGPLNGAAITLGFGTGNGTAPVTGTYVLTENGATVRSGNVAGASTSYTVAGTSGQDIVLTVTWDNAYGDPVSASATVTIGSVTPAFDPDAAFALWATAADTSDLAGLTGAQPTITGGVMAFTPTGGGGDVLAGPIDRPEIEWSGAAGVYTVIAMQVSPQASGTRPGVIGFSGPNAWPPTFGLALNGYLNRFAVGSHAQEEVAVGNAGTAWHVVEFWDDTVNVYCRVDNGPLLTVAPGRTYTAPTWIRMLSQSATAYTFSIAALGVADGIPDASGMDAARAWAEGLIP